MTQIHPASDPIAELWRAARAWLAETLRCFGGPAAIAAAAALGAAFKRRLVQLEAVVAKLLLIEAARIPSLAPVRAAAARVRRALQRALPAEDPARPETWRVRFVPRLGAAPGRRMPPPRPSRAVIPAQAKSRALARRLEALRRVLADPRRAVASLARRLAALAAAAFAAARRLAFAARRYAADPLSAHALVCASDASFAWEDTS